MITATNEDCMDLLKRTPDKYFELSIVCFIRMYYVY